MQRKYKLFHAMDDHNCCNTLLIDVDEWDAKKEALILTHPTHSELLNMLIKYFAPPAWTEVTYCETITISGQYVGTMGGVYKQS